MLRGLAALLLFQLIGECLVFLVKLPVPGPVIGLILLFVFLRAMQSWKGTSFPQIETASGALLSNLGLLFVPAGVGVVSLWGVVRTEAGPIAAVLVLSAIVTLVATVWTFIAARRLLARHWGA
ncbi:CidA/LrgA family protein [Rhizobium sp. SSA_523]|uniref:CidA/LrgA family protein n=1 Tax=Rhizobium sp. SSA_523 TaxID=2952477 RepID=UPI002090D91E|nr:CidA/LrgA family protein [Rhizobium sp. SSA_523]MCO5732947.1 CidA/LrgA family protein [Rhizobium sp. SSA_523]WKC23833.1 CidA/LrgA family protein [Rhizobium sp. SSA_523]